MGNIPRELFIATARTMGSFNNSQCLLHHSKNGVAERKNRTLVEGARNMLEGKNISNGFWAEAIITVVYFLK